MEMKTNYNKSKVKDPYLNIAWMYNVWSALTESKALSKALEIAVIKNGESFLEVAVGTGSFFEQAVELNPRGRNEGLDISEPMLKKAKKRLRKYKNFNLIQEDASKLPYGSNTFDILVSNYMFDLLPEKRYAVILKEFKRVLKPSGRLVITTMTNGREWYSKIWNTIAKNIPSLLTGCRPINLESAIMNAGFKIRKAEYITQNTFPSLVISAKK